MTIKNKSLFISIFLTLNIALFNFTNAMEGQRPDDHEGFNLSVLADAVSYISNSMEGQKPETRERINLGNKKRKLTEEELKEYFNIIPNLAWSINIGFPNELAKEDVLNRIFHAENKDFVEKFLGLPLNFIKLNLNKVSQNSIVPAITVVMKYVIKFDTTDKAIKPYWELEVFYDKKESISTEDPEFKQFQDKLQNIVNNIVELLKLKLPLFTNNMAQMNYVVHNIGTGKKIMLYNVKMNLSFVLVPTNFTDEMERQMPENPKKINLGNKISSANGPLIRVEEQNYRIERSLGWVVDNKFSDEISIEDIQGIFDNINQEVDNKLSELSFNNAITITLNGNLIEPRPSIIITMRYVQKFDTKDNEIKRYWKRKISCRKNDSGSSEEEKLFVNKLRDIVKDIEKILEPKLLYFIDIDSLETYLISNMKNDEEIILYDVTMNLSFVLEPAQE